MGISIPIFLLTLLSRHHSRFLSSTVFCSHIKELKKITSTSSIANVSIRILRNSRVRPLLLSCASTVCVLSSFSSISSYPLHTSALAPPRATSEREFPFFSVKIVCPLLPFFFGVLSCLFIKHFLHLYTRQAGRSVIVIVPVLQPSSPFKYFSCSSVATTILGTVLLK